MSDSAASAGVPLDRVPPAGTSGRIRNRAIWSVALFAASIPPTIIGLGIAHFTPDAVNIAVAFATAFWLFGVLGALWAAFPTIRYWEGLTGQTRWLGALPLLTISTFVTAALIGAMLV